MRKFFILTLMVASLIMVSCVEKRNLVTLDRFVPITPDDNCEIKPGGEHIQMEGMIDLAFTSDYRLAFQITNNIPSGTGGGSESSLTTTETNYFYADKVEIEYDWWPKTQEKTDGQPRLKLDQSLWNKNTRTMDYPIMALPNGSQYAGYVHVFNDAQAKDLLRNLLEEAPTFDWIENPLTVKIRVIGELSDGTEVKTNQLKISIRPNFGQTIQAGSVYYTAKDEEDQPVTDENGKVIRTKEQAEWDRQHNQCSFGEPVVNGCLPGQDTSQVNCHAGDSPWHKYIVEKYCKEEPCHVYTAGSGAAEVVTMIYNSYKKAGEDGKYLCCPLSENEEPEDPEEDDNSAAGE